MRPRLALPALLLAGAVGLAACSSGQAAHPSSSSGGPAVAKPSDVSGLLAATMAKNNRANASLDSSLLSSYEAASALEIDAATYKAQRIAQQKAHYKVPNTPFTVHMEASALQRESAWPVQYLVGGRTTSTSSHAPAGPRCDSLLDFEKTGPSKAWKIVLEPGIGPSLPSLALQHRFAAPVSAGAVRAADGLAREVSRALVRLETTGQLGPFKRSDFTGSCWQLPDPRVDIVNAEAAGYSARDTYSPVVPADTSVFALRGGATLALFTISFTDELVATSPSSPVSWSHPSLKKSPSAAWTYMLAAGRYLQVNEKGQLQVAAVLSSSHKSYSIIGDYYGITAVTGSRDHAKTKPKAPKGTLAAARLALG